MFPNMQPLALKILLSIGIFLEREDTLAAETKSPMQTFAVSDISSLSFLFLLAEHAMYKILNNTCFKSKIKYSKT